MEFARFKQRREFCRWPRPFSIVRPVRRVFGRPSL